MKARKDVIIRRNNVTDGLNKNPYEEIFKSKLVSFQSEKHLNIYCVCDAGSEK